MNIEMKTIVCDGKNHRIIHYHLDLNDPIFATALQQGAELAGKVDIHDPAGLTRDLKTRVAKCTGGMIAQKIFQDFFNEELQNRTASDPRLSKIEFFEPASDCSKGQIDFIIRSKSGHANLLLGETRSSFSYKTASIDNVVKYAMSLLGPYVTTNKPFEVIKDIHTTIIHRIDPQDLLANAASAGLDSFIVGGGTRKMFLDLKIMEKDNLYQRGATYYKIQPMWHGLDAIETVDNIISAAVSKLH